LIDTSQITNFHKI